MTLSGKVVIVNSLLASSFVYKMQVLPTISHAIVTQVEEEIKRLFWKGK